MHGVSGAGNVLNRANIYFGAGKTSLLREIAPVVQACGRSQRELSAGRIQDRFFRAGYSPREQVAKLSGYKTDIDPQTGKPFTFEQIKAMAREVQKQKKEKVTIEGIVKGLAHIFTSLWK